MSSPSKLFSCVDAVEILKSPINTSTAKNHWSFSRSPRFPQKPVYCDQIYELPSTIVKRHTSKPKNNEGFGYGKKTDLNVGKHPHQITPSPDKYNLDTFIDTNKNHNTGYTCAIGRQLTSPRSYIELEPMKVPGPGTYRDAKIRDTPNWSFRPRTSSEFFPNSLSYTQKIVPGPGQYKHLEAFDPKGNYKVSKFRNSLSKAWNPKTSHRFNKSTTDVPGPGTYRPVNDLPKDGSHYVLSNNHSDGKRMILKSNRDSFVDQPGIRTKTPGPGRYRLPSDFGIYDHQGECRHESMHGSMYASTASMPVVEDKQNP